MGSGAEGSGEVGAVRHRRSTTRGEARGEVQDLTTAEQPTSVKPAEQEDWRRKL
jgi:hypothetical protein